MIRKAGQVKVYSRLVPYGRWRRGSLGTGGTVPTSLHGINGLIPGMIMHIPYLTLSHYTFFSYLTTGMTKGESLAKN